MLGQTSGAVSATTALGILLAWLSGSGPWSWQRGRSGWLAVAPAGLAHWVLTRRGYVAITLGRLVVATRPLTPAERRHESAHLIQYRADGWAFLPRYLRHHRRAGYLNNPYEVSARLAEDAGVDLLP